MSGWSSGAAHAAEARTTELEARVREAHHRVSNHLQILASLLGLEARANIHHDVAGALLAVRGRILAIAQLNSALQHSKVSGMVDLKVFLNRMGQELRRCFSSTYLMELPLELDIEQAMAPAEQAVTVALIVNELVTNSVKHAVLPYGGRVAVRLRRQADQRWRLTVFDEGPGLPQSAFEGADEHGLDLIRILVRQLRGEVAVEQPSHGAAISVRFG